MKQSAAFKGAREQSHIQLETFSSETARWVEPRPDADAKLAEIENTKEELSQLWADYGELEAYSKRREAEIATLRTAASEASKECERLRAIKHAFRHVDNHDWNYLFNNVLNDSGNGKFWKAVMTELSRALSKGE